MNSKDRRKLRRHLQHTGLNQPDLIQTNQTQQNQKIPQNQISKQDQSTQTNNPDQTNNCQTTQTNETVHTTQSTQTNPGQLTNLGQTQLNQPTKQTTQQAAGSFHFSQLTQPELEL